MSKNAEAIIILCSRLCVSGGAESFEPAEWASLAQTLVEKKLEPGDLLSLAAADLAELLGLSEAQLSRVNALKRRGGSIAFELERLRGAGINIVTRADGGYPAPLKKKIGKSCPPLFFYAGDLDLLRDDCAGVVGSREIGAHDEEFIKKIVGAYIKNGFSVVSGGARGADGVARDCALSGGGAAIEFLSDGLQKRLNNAADCNAVRDGRLLLLSAVSPGAPFTAGGAMARNKYIYAQSEMTTAVKSDLGKGGTWAGAVECLKNAYCPLFCWDNKSYAGNQELIKKGAISITADFTFTAEELEKHVKPIKAAEEVQPDILTC